MLRRSCVAQPRLINRRAVLGALLAAGVLAASGCGESGGRARVPVPRASGDEDVESTGLMGAIEGVARDAAQLATGARGSIDLTLDPPLKLDVCRALRTPSAAGRSGTLQLTSQLDPKEKETFPAVMVWADLGESSLEALVGKTVPATLFIQREETSGTWHSPLASPVMLQVAAVDSLTVTLKLENIPLARADGEEQVTINGTLVGAIQ
ncbi:hypothetical protein Psta_1674 [Pirellula staleyi DSM 6068]|uniref:Lipoprotein n=1 Tax=Pirellula staleyi (strain ATCC 27377 / DSM 6068 / ICPB 4128) TaxID=530564 RepID=D2QYD5_PIRSD|nr:hypothetical protein [Pirellula staleyi]ADB16349.1 hypothetical protein Psta_1674 [Pirellula staleyi DSM 6068]